MYWRGVKSQVCAFKIGVHIVKNYHLIVPNMSIAKVFYYYLWVRISLLKSIGSKLLLYPLSKLMYCGLMLFLVVSNHLILVFCFSSSVPSRGVRGKEEGGLATKKSQVILLPLLEKRTVIAMMVGIGIVGWFPLFLLQWSRLEYRIRRLNFKSRGRNKH